MMWILFAIASSAIGEQYDHILPLFDKFRDDYNITYPHDIVRYRFGVFVDNVLEAQRLNEGESEEVFGVTKFSGMTKEEFRQMLGYRRSSESRNLTVMQPSGGFEAPSTFDWRDKNAVTKVKDQGQCGSCWAFSAVEEIESTWFLAGNELKDFAPQQVVSCDRTDDGCNGGDTLTAYKYVQKAGGLSDENKYPYRSGDSGRTGVCKVWKIKSDGGDVTGHTWATPQCQRGKCNDQDEDKLKNNLAETAPVSICVNAENWQNYKRGVMSGSKCGGHSVDDLDHCVQLVGYGDNYWMVRNSWNTDWGIDGYIHLEMGTNACGVANEATITDF